MSASAAAGLGELLHGAQGYVGDQNDSGYLSVRTLLLDLEALARLSWVHS